jgi:hypothetical protein
MTCQSFKGDGETQFRQVDLPQKAAHALRLSLLHAGISIFHNDIICPEDCCRS